MVFYKFSRNAHICGLSGKLLELHFNVSLFSNPVDKFIIIVRINAPRISECNIYFILKTKCYLSYLAEKGCIVCISQCFSPHACTCPWRCLSHEGGDEEGRSRNPHLQYRLREGEPLLPVILVFCTLIFVSLSTVYQPS